MDQVWDYVGACILCFFTSKLSAFTPREDMCLTCSKQDHERLSTTNAEGKQQLQPSQETVSGKLQPIKHSQHKHHEYCPFPWSPGACSSHSGVPHYTNEKL